MRGDRSIPRSPPGSGTPPSRISRTSSPPHGPATAAELAALATDDYLEDIEVCRRALAREGIELLLLDQTRPDIGVPVVKVLAPGLRHFRARLAPGRLYDVPVSMGWLTEPHAEADLNPIPFFL